MIRWAQLGFQDANSPIMEKLIHLHDSMTIILVGILRFVVVVTRVLLINKRINIGLLETQTVLYIMRFAHIVIYVLIFFSSLSLLCIIDEKELRRLTIKTAGFRWY